MPQVMVAEVYGNEMISSIVKREKTGGGGERPSLNYQSFVLAKF